MDDWSSGALGILLHVCDCRKNCWPVLGFMKQLMKGSADSSKPWYLYTLFPSGKKSSLMISCGYYCQSIYLLTHKSGRGVACCWSYRHWSKCRRNWFVVSPPIEKASGWCTCPGCFSNLEWNSSILGTTFEGISCSTCSAQVWIWT